MFQSPPTSWCLYLGINMTHVCIHHLYIYIILHRIYASMHHVAALVATSTTSGSWQSNLSISLATPDVGRGTLVWLLQCPWEKTSDQRKTLCSVVEVNSSIHSNNLQHVPLQDVGPKQCLFSKSSKTRRPSLRLCGQQVIFKGCQLFP